VARPNKLNNN